MLNLPEEKHSHGLRKLAAVEAARGSMEDASAAISRATGAKMGNARRWETLGRGAGPPCGGGRGGLLCLAGAARAAGKDCPLVLTFDGKGIVMRPEALRPATAKAARTAENKLVTRLAPGEKHGRKRMAEVAGVYDAVPVPRSPEQVIRTPAQKRKEKKEKERRAAAGKREKPREPRAREPAVTAMR